MAEPQRDAFGNIISLDSDLDKPTTYNIYENRPFSTGLGASLQDVYGVQGGLPMFQFIRQVKTGERTYDPRRPEDRRFRDQYEQYRQQNPQAPTFAQAIGEVFIGGGVPVVGATIEGIVNPGGYYQGDTLSRAGQGALDTFSDSPQQLVQSQIGGFDTNLYNLKPDQAFIPELADIKTATATGNKDLFNALDDAKVKLTTQETNILGNQLPPKTVYDTGKLAEQGFGFDPQGKLVDTFANEPSAFVDNAGNVSDSFTANPQDYQALTSAPAITTTTQGGFQGYVSDVGSQLSPSTAAGQSNFATAGGAGITAAAATLIMTGDVEKAAKTGVGTTVGKAIGTAITLGNPIGGIIGGIIGGALGGRVICNELMRQGMMDRKQVILDYKFTRDYLTPTHVQGYHIWAVWMVKQMRKGRFVKLWSHIAGHRANEIEYIYGERDKPDYLGKIYRKVLEPICWTVGLICKKTDWSILYKTKEI